MNENKRIIIPRGRQGLKGDKGDQGDGAATLGPRLDKLESPTTHNVIYWNAVNGNDANDGWSGPIQTAQRLCELLKSGVTNLVILQSDVVWDYYFDIQNDLKIDISGGSTTYFSITFKDAINKSTRKGGIRNEANGTVILLYTKIYMDGLVSAPVFDAVIGKWKCRTYVTDFERVGNAQGYIFGNSYAGELIVHFQSSAFTNISGYLFEGVGPNQNPNDRFLVYTNLNAV